MGRRTRPFTAAERAAIAGPFNSRDARRHLQNLLLGLRVEGEFFTAVARRLEALREVPTLLLYGALDHGYKLGFVDRWKQLLPRHEVAILDRSDHFAPEDQPDDYTAALATWWQGAIGTVAG